MITLNFRTLTPLHISTGNDLAHNLHYILIDQEVRVVNTIKLSSYLAEKHIFDFSKNYSLEDIRAIVNSRKSEIAELCSKYSINTTTEFQKYLGSENRVGQTFILEFINSNGKFYIPASSVKGSLLTILHKEYLGIKEEKVKNQVVKKASIQDKFVIHDSDYIPNSDFAVYRTGYGRPPINLMCLDSKKEFTLKIPKHGELSVTELKSKMKDYYPTQISKALKLIKKYVSERNPDAGANVFVEILSGLADLHLEPNEYLINLGFGSGSWFKLFNDSAPPTFYNKKTKNNEEAHTTFALLQDADVSPLGWCILTIEDES